MLQSQQLPFQDLDILTSTSHESRKTFTNLQKDALRLQ